MRLYNKLEHYAQQADQRFELYSDWIDNLRGLRNQTDDPKIAEMANRIIALLEPEIAEHIQKQAEFIEYFATPEEKAKLLLRKKMPGGSEHVHN